MINKQNVVAPLLFIMTISAGLTIDGLGLQHWVKLPRVEAEQTKIVLSPTPTQKPTQTPEKAEKPINKQQRMTNKPTPNEVKAYILEVFGDRAGKQAIKMLSQCENSTFDQSRKNHNRNGSIDYGVFQLNSVHFKRRGRKFVTDWRENVRVAKQIYDEQGWRPWSCAYVIGVKPFYKH